MNGAPEEIPPQGKIDDSDEAAAVVGTKLAPLKHRQLDVFVAALADVATKDDMHSMEHPFFSLSKRKDMTIRVYERNGNQLEVQPSAKGMATIWDKDVLIYCASQIVHAKNLNLTVSRRVQFVARDYLMATNRGVSGADYKAMEQALDRLAGTRFKTNIKAGGQEFVDNFGLIESYRIVREGGTSEGRMVAVELVLSKWYFDAVNSNEVLTLDPDYFRISSAIERRLYEMVRKHVGRQPSFRAGLDTIYDKSGSDADIKEFRRAVKKIAGGTDAYQLLRYMVWYCAATDQLIGVPKGPEGLAIINDLMQKHPPQHARRRAGTGTKRIEAAAPPEEEPTGELF